MPPLVCLAHNRPMGCSPFSLDAQAPSREPSRATAGSDASGPEKPIGVLVIDDDSRVLAAIGQTIALEADLVVVAEAADPTRAMAMADLTDPSVALVDVLLPDATTGLALVVALAQRPGCAVVAMSVHSSLRAEAVAAGAAAFVEKAGDIQAILDALRAAAPPSGA